MRMKSLRRLRRKGGKVPDPGAVMLDDAVARGRVDLAALFGNTRPVEIEIGVGKGAFLLVRAKARPEINLLGIEYAKSYAMYSADRIRRAALMNARILRCDAGHFFKVCLGDRSLWRVHIYFPDPWPKRRHLRRRLVQTAFIKDVRRTLKPGGQLIIITDHYNYFCNIRRVVTATSGFVRTGFPRAANADGEVVGTNFERKYIAQGRPFYLMTRMRYEDTTIRA